MTALGIAIGAGKLRIAAMLVRKGADVRAPQGQTDLKTYMETALGGVQCKHDSSPLLLSLTHTHILSLTYTNTHALSTAGSFSNMEEYKELEKLMKAKGGL